jgi:hypothetical protein
LIVSLRTLRPSSPFNVSNRTLPNRPAARDRRVGTREDRRSYPCPWLRKRTVCRLAPDENHGTTPDEGLVPRQLLNGTVLLLGAVGCPVARRRRR